MKLELTRHLLPLTIIFFVTSLIWTIGGTPIINYFLLILGLTLGAFFLDIDHLIYWLYLEPNLDESKLAQTAWKKGDFRSLLKLLESTHHQHTNLIFHHYFFQVVLALISFFVFTSSSFIWAKGFLLAINIHLLVDEFYDFKKDPSHLQEWLFARESKQLPVKNLKNYLITFTVISFIFTYLLIIS